MWSQRVTLLGALELLLGELARIDVRHRAGEANRPARGVARADPAGVNPVIAAVLVAHAPLALPPRRAAFQVVAHRRLAPRRVVRMNAMPLSPLGLVAHIDTVRGASHADLLGTRREIGHVVRQVPVPDAVLRAGDRERKALLG